MTLPCIVSIGTAVPSNKISQNQHFDFVSASFPFTASELARLQKIYKSSGIDSRYSVINDFDPRHPNESSAKHQESTTGQRMDLYKQNALSLCLQAVKDCLGQTPSFSLKEITHLITFSCTGMYAPGLDIELINELHLNVNIERSSINFMGCYAAFTALKMAGHIIRSMPKAKVLLVGVELCSIHSRVSNDPDQLVANAIFGDGAAAVLLTSEEEMPQSKDTLRFGLQAFYSEFTYAQSDMAWTIGDHGFNLKLSAFVPKIIEKGIAELINKLLQKDDFKDRDSLLYAIHPGGTAILKACEKALGITKEKNEKSYAVLQEYGNMSSITVLFVLKEYLKSLRLSDASKKIMSCAFGPGITIESMLLKIV
jgi:alpha-pyrone synthase